MSAAILNHVGLAVRDLEAAKRLYVEGLGFQEWFGFTLPDEPSATLLALEPPVGLSVAYLTLGSFVLELIAMDKAFEERPPRVMNELGLTHLSLSVASVPDTVTALLALGATVVSDIGVAVMVRDPDGQLLELLPATYRTKLPPLPG